MHRIAIGVPLVAASVFLAGCQGMTPISAIEQATATGGKVADEVVGYTAEMLDSYCLYVPGLARASLRGAINAKTTRAYISIECAVLPEPATRTE